MGKIVGLVFEAEKFRCPTCGEVCKSAAALDKHVKEKHPASPGGKK